MQCIGAMDRNRDIKIELVEGRAMTNAEVEAVASLLFTWWRREFEQESLLRNSPTETKGLFKEIDGA